MVSHELNHHTVFVRGYNITTPDFKNISSRLPYQGSEPRFHKVDELLYFIGDSNNAEGIPLINIHTLLHPIRYCKQIIHDLKMRLTGQVVTIKTPVFFHMKYLTSNDGACGKKEYAEMYHNVPINVLLSDICYKTMEDYL
jgi:hypothetical protein